MRKSLFWLAFVVARCKTLALTLNVSGLSSPTLNVSRIIFDSSIKDCTKPVSKSVFFLSSFNQLLSYYSRAGFEIAFTHLLISPRLPQLPLRWPYHLYLFSSACKMLYCSSSIFLWGIYLYNSYYVIFTGFLLNSSYHFKIILIA